MGMANWSGRATLFTQLFWDHFQLPLFIVENGFGAVDQRQADGTVNDHYRIDYFASHIREMKKAVVEDGVDLIGYTPWGCIDLVSAGTGEMKKRYGMIYVDKDNEGKGTLERIRKASFYWYRDLIANNGENIWDFRKILRRCQALWSEPDNNYIACWL